MRETEVRAVQEQSCYWKFYSNTFTVTITAETEDQYVITSTLRQCSFFSKPFVGQPQPNSAYQVPTQQSCGFKQSTGKGVVTFHTDFQVPVALTDATHLAYTFVAA